MRQIKFILLILGIIASSSYTFSQVRAVVGVTGSMFNYVDKNPISVEMQVYDNAGKKVNATKSNGAENGYYYVTGLFPGNTYIFVVKDKNYLTERFEVSIPNSDKYVEISKDFLLKPNNMGTQIKLNVSPFEFNKSKLKPGSAIILNEVLNTVKYNPNAKFQIISYPDTDKNPIQNEELTKKRAQALIDFFELNGVDSSMFTIQSNKNTDPKNPPPAEKRAKGKKYIGSIYLVVG